jgi:tRNA dimethylallyltransferase
MKPTMPVCELARLDPAAAARLAPHDAQHIQRALEIDCLRADAVNAVNAVREAMLAEMANG